MTEASGFEVRDSPSVLRVVQVLQEQRVRGAVTILDEHARTARLAADQLGIDIGQIANSLIFRAHLEDGEVAPLLVLASGAHRVDIVQVADTRGLDEISKADAAFVREHTGFAIGGVPPIAHRTPPLTVVDIALSRYRQVWAAAGHPRAVFPTSYNELLRLTGGQSAEVA
jgi:prolyl-tRNA editing enzyme YbaK/EbsC (Cys-tRNA(Pro) deacylase)